MRRTPFCVSGEHKSSGVPPLRPLENTSKIVNIISTQTNLVELARGKRTIEMPNEAFKQWARKCVLVLFRSSVNWPMHVYKKVNVIVTIAIIDHIPGL